MSSTKGKIFRLLSSMVLKPAAIVSLQDLGGFRRLVLRAEVPRFAAGMKVQLLLPSDDTRTYTPIQCPDGFTLLGWKHAGGPGARWLAGVTVGAELSFLGPQRSLELPPGPVLIVGDETSVAVAASFESERPGAVHAVIQGGATADIRDAAESVGRHQLDVVARGNHQATVEAVVAKLAETPDSAIALTGCSELIVAVRGLLRETRAGNIKTKTYWIPGKAGLD